MAKRITIPIDNNLDAVRAQLREELGVDLSYHQLVDYLIKFYRTNKQPRSIWNDRVQVVPKKNVV